MTFVSGKASEGYICKHDVLTENIALYHSAFAARRLATVGNLRLKKMRFWLDVFVTIVQLDEALISRNSARHCHRLIKQMTRKIERQTRNFIRIFSSEQKMKQATF